MYTAWGELTCYEGFTPSGAPDMDAETILTNAARELESTRVAAERRAEEDRLAAVAVLKEKLKADLMAAEVKRKEKCLIAFKEIERLVIAEKANLIQLNDDILRVPNLPEAFVAEYTRRIAVMTEEFLQKGVESYMWYGKEALCPPPILEAPPAADTDSS